MDPVEIAAGAVQLRPFDPTHLTELVTACQDPEIARWTRVPSPYTNDDAESFLLAAGLGWAEETAFTLGAFESTSGDLLGAVTLQRSVPGDPALAEIGFWVAAPARGRGIATTAVGSLCRWGFAALALARIEWLAAVGNAASRRVAEKCGFRAEGVARARVEVGELRQDAWVAALLPGEV